MSFGDNMNIAILWKIWYEWKCLWTQHIYGNCYRFGLVLLHLYTNDGILWKQYTRKSFTVRCNVEHNVIQWAPYIRRSYGWQRIVFGIYLNSRQFRTMLCITTTRRLNIHCSQSIYYICMCTFASASLWIGTIIYIIHISSMHLNYEQCKYDKAIVAYPTMST